MARLTILLLAVFAAGCIRESDRQLNQDVVIYTEYAVVHGVAPGDANMQAANDAARRLGERLGPPKNPRKTTPAATKETIKQSKAEDASRDYFLGLSAKATAWAAGLGIPGLGTALGIGAWLWRKKKQLQQLAERNAVKGQALMAGLNRVKETVLAAKSGDVTAAGLMDVAKGAFEAAGVGAEIYADFKAGDWKKVVTKMPGGGVRTVLLSK